MTADHKDFQFDNVEVRPGRFEVLKAGVETALEPKSVRLLLYLVENRDRAVSKEELIQAVWQGNAVTDNAITRVIAQLRRELGDDARQPRYIVTIPTLGYRFIADVQPLHSQPDPLPVPVPLDPPARSGRPLRPLAAALVLLLAIGGASMWLLRGRAPAVQPTLPSEHVQVTTSPGLDLSPSFSPDGRSLAYTSDRSGQFEIYVRTLESGGREIQLTSDASQNLEPAWSPDGKWIAYHSAGKRGIWVIPAAGGEPRRVAENGSQPAWSPDSKRLVFRSTNATSLAANDQVMSLQEAAILSAAIDGGPVTVLSPMTANRGRQGFASWRPDGKRILFSVVNGRTGELWTVAPDGSALRRLYATDRNVFISPAWSPRGDAIYYGAVSKLRDLGLWRLRLNAARDGADGTPQELVRTGSAIPRDLAVTSDGKRLAYASSTMSSTLWNLPLDQKGERPAGEARPLYNHVVYRTSFPVFSPDGRRIAFFARVFGGGGDIWVMNADGSGAAPVTSGASPDLLPSWTPDGTSLVYTKHVDSTEQLWQMSLADRSEKPLLNGRSFPGWPRLAPDGKTVVYHTTDSRRMMNIWTTDLVSGESRQLTAGGQCAGFPSWSPDGKQIAYELFEGDDTYLALMDRDGRDQKQLNKEAGHSWVFNWSPDGRRLLFAGLRNGAWNLWSYEIETGRQTRLTDHRTLASYVRYPSASPAGDRIVYEYAVLKGNIYTLALP